MNQERDEKQKGSYFLVDFNEFFKKRNSACLQIVLKHFVTESGTALKDGAGVPGLIGIMAVLFVLVVLTAAFVVSLRRPWTRIAVRVAGSWVAASGLLMLGWFIRGAGMT